MTQKQILRTLVKAVLLLIAYSKGNFVNLQSLYEDIEKCRKALEPGAITTHWPVYRKGDWDWEPLCGSQNDDDRAEPDETATCPDCLRIAPHGITAEWLLDMGAKCKKEAK